MKKTTVEFVCFGEVNTLIERLQMKHDEALSALAAQVDGIVDGDVYNTIGKPWPMEKITAYIAACCAKKNLRSARVGTMGYRDMLLYGTQYEGNSMRGQIGVDVEPYEMLEMVRAIDTLDAEKIAEGIRFVKENWVFKKECDDSVI